MDVRIGDVYFRNSDEKPYRVKKIDNKMIVLESEETGQLALTDIFGLEKAYTKKQEPDQ